MECGNDELPSAATLLDLVVAVPAWHYTLALLLLVSFFFYGFLEIHLLGDVLRGLRGGKVLLTFNQSSEACRGLVSRCRTLRGRYLATPWLSSPHLQTLFIGFFGNPPAFSYRRQMFCVSDGGTIALDWLQAPDDVGCSSDTSKVIMEDDTTPIVVIVPGLTSASDSPYIKHIVHKIAKRGWNVVVSNHRGLGGVSITSDRIYNAGWTEDVRKVINHLRQEYPKAPLFAIGTSIGGNILVKYLGEDGEGTPIAGAASICSPWDLLVCDRFITRKLVQKMYDRALTIGLQGYAQLHQPVMSRVANWEGIKKSRSVRDFDNHATCLVAKYETVDTYYRRCSSANFVGNVAVPLLCISALDDPVCTKEAIPWDECRANKNIILATTAHGGHLGFFEGITASSLWWVRAVDDFLGVLSSSPYMHGQKQTYVVGVSSSLGSSIDKAPYVNVMEDGLVATVGSEANDDNDERPNSDRVVCNTQGQETDVPIVQALDATIPDSQPEEKTLDVPQKSPEHPSPRGAIGASNFQDAIAPVNKSINQLSRLNVRSIWLLAYIAIVTTYPLVAPALLVALKRRFKKVLPAAWFNS